MGTHSTTTNQQVGLRITEMCREASKMSQNDVGEEQQKVDTGGEAACWKARLLLSHCERTATVSSAEREREMREREKKDEEKEKVSATNFTRKKKWQLLISAVKKMCRGRSGCVKSVEDSQNGFRRCFSK